MPLKPVDQRRQDETRDAIWQAIRATRSKKAHELNREFTARDLWYQTTSTLETVREYLTGLHRAGYITKTGTVKPDARRLAATTYRLIRDAGIEAPRVRRDGTEITQGRGRENMWRTIPILQEFTGRELAIAASTERHAIAETEAEGYCQILALAGYLLVVEKGRSHHPARYQHRPSKYTGPKPPQVQRVRQLYDPNVRKVVWEGGASDCK